MTSRHLERTIRDTPKSSDRAQSSSLSMQQNSISAIIRRVYPPLPRGSLQGRRQEFVFPLGDVLQFLKIGTHHPDFHMLCLQTVDVDGYGLANRRKSNWKSTCRGIWPGALLTNRKKYILAKKGKSHSCEKNVAISKRPWCAPTDIISANAETESIKLIDVSIR